MGEVADGDLMLFHDIGEERALVVDAEGEDSMLVGKGKSSAVHSAVFRAARREERETMEGRKHGELELHCIPVGDFERHEPVKCILGELNVERLQADVNPRGAQQRAKCEHIQHCS